MTENSNYAQENKFIERLPKLFEDLKGHFSRRANIRYGIPPQDISDMVQQTYLDIQKKVSQPEFRELGNGIRGLALTIFDRKCKDYLGNSRMVKFIEIDDQIFFGGNVLDDISEREALRVITEHVEELPEIYKRAINHQINGTYSGKTDGTHRSRVKRARTILKDNLSKSGIFYRDIEVD